MAHQESFDPEALRPDRIPRPVRPDQHRHQGRQVRPTLQKPRQDRRQDHRHPLDDARRGRPRARHPQHVHRLPPAARPSTTRPSGSVVSHELGPRDNLPPYVCIPTVPNEFAGSGYLSSAYGPFALGNDPANKAVLRCATSTLPKGVDDKRFDRRRSLLATVDDHFRILEDSDALDSMDAFYQHAYKLISSQKAREAFNIDAEDDKLRDQLRPQRRPASGCCSPAAWSKPASASSRSPPAAGTTTTTSRPASKAAPACRPRHRHPHPRPRRTRPARQHPGHAHLRVRPHPEDQQDRRPRPLAARVLGDARRRRHQKRPRSTAPPMPSAAKPRRTRSASPTSPPPSTTSSASPPTRNSWPPATARSKSSTAARSSTDPAGSNQADLISRARTPPSPPAPSDSDSLPEEAKPA